MTSKNVHAKYIQPYDAAERLAIKLEHIPRPTPKQVHEAENEMMREFAELYGEFDMLPQWRQLAGQ